MSASASTPDLKRLVQRTYVALALGGFIGLPLLLYALGGAPRRSLLKEGISVVTLLAFSLTLGQFFLARSNQSVLSAFSLKGVKAVHTWMAAFVVTVLLLHPALIVFPRFFEAGITPADAFVRMLTTVDNLGVVLGIVAWCCLLLLVPTSIARIRLIKVLGANHPKWRIFHGALSVVLTTTGLVHAITLGRHASFAMASSWVLITFAGIALLVRMYVVTPPKASKPLSAPPRGEGHVPPPPPPS